MFPMAFNTFNKFLQWGNNQSKRSTKLMRDVNVKADFHLADFLLFLFIQALHQNLSLHILAQPKEAQDTKQ